MVIQGEFQSTAFYWNVIFSRVIHLFWKSYRESQREGEAHTHAEREREFPCASWLLRWVVGAMNSTGQSLDKELHLSFLHGSGPTSWGYSAVSKELDENCSSWHCCRMLLFRAVALSDILQLWPVYSKGGIIVEVFIKSILVTLFTMHYSQCLIHVLHYHNSILVRKKINTVKKSEVRRWFVGSFIVKDHNPHTGVASGTGRGINQFTELRSSTGQCIRWLYRVTQQHGAIYNFLHFSSSDSSKPLHACFCGLHFLFINTGTVSSNIQVFEKSKK